MTNDLVSVYLTNKFKASGLKKIDVVKDIGYKNISKGLRKLDSALSGNIEQTDFIVKLSKVINFSIEEFKDVYKNREKIIKQQEYNECKNAFQPHLFAVTVNKIPSPIFVGAMFQHLRYIILDDNFLNQEYIDQLANIGNLIRYHIVNNDGEISAFGKIKYYIFQRCFEEQKKDRLCFDINGILIDNPEPTDESEPGVATLEVKGRSILPFLKLDNEQNVF
jgi:hypothetical protein